MKTPSFGGVGIVLSVAVGTVLFSLFSFKVLWCISLFVSFAGVGFYDDSLSLFFDQNKGLTAKRKFCIQVVVAMFFLAVFSLYIRQLSWWQYGMYLFLFVGVSNATNLTDGLDGLLGGLSVLTLIGFLSVFVSWGLWDLVGFSMILMASILGFLFFNFFPAKIFMGDTGSLALGAIFSGFALLLDNPWILISLGAPYLVETASVIIQVLYFKLTKRRVFLMAPLHHHFELLNVSERRVVFGFWVFGLGCLLLFLLN